MRKKNSTSNQVVSPDRQVNRRARAQTGGVDKDIRRVSPRSGDADLQPGTSHSTRSSPGRIALTTSASPAKRQPQQSPPVRRSFTNDQHGQPNGTLRNWSNGLYSNLPPIPASPYASEPSTPASRKSISLGSSNGKSSPKEEKQRPDGGSNAAVANTEDVSLSRSRSKSSSYVPYKSPAPQSLNAAVEMLSLSERRSTSEHGHPAVLRPGAPESKPRPSTSSSSSKHKEKRDLTQSPTKSSHTHVGFWMTRSTSTPPTVNGKAIGSPIPNEGEFDCLTSVVCLTGRAEASLDMSPLKNRSKGKPIPVVASGSPPSSILHVTATLASGSVHQYFAKSNLVDDCILEHILFFLMTSPPIFNNSWNQIMPGNIFRRTVRDLYSAVKSRWPK